MPIHIMVDSMIDILSSKILPDDDMEIPGEHDNPNDRPG